jgi:hypothetical protein
MFHKNVKIIFIISLLSFGLMTQLKAQDKYHVARVYSSGPKTVVVIMDDKPIQEFSVESLGTQDNLQGVLIEVNHLTQEGWEIINANEGGASVYYFTFYLKKKY